MKLRLHPDITWTGQYFWKDVHTEDFKAVSGISHTEAVNENRDINLVCNVADITLSFISSQILRIQVKKKPYNNEIDKEIQKLEIINNEYSGIDTLLTMNNTGNELQLSSDKLKIKVSNGEFNFNISDPADDKTLLCCKSVKIDKSKAKPGYIFEFENTLEDHFFGFGGRTCSPDRKGTTYDLFSVKVAHQRGDYGGFAIPFFMNTRGYGFLLNNPFPHVYFDLGYNDSGKWFFYAPDGPVDMYILAGPGFDEILANYYYLTGKPVVPPKWMLGLWISWCNTWKDRDWIEWVSRFRREKWPVDVVVLDYLWRGGVLASMNEAKDGCNLDWDSDGFGDGPAFLREMHDKNVKVCLHLNTRMLSGKTRDEGIKKGCLREAAEEQVVPVLGDSDSIEWNWNLYKARVEEGVDLWWTDNGERVDGEVGCGVPSRNLFGHLWNRFLYEGMESMGKTKRLVLSRGGWAGAQKYTIPWPGDSKPGVDRLKEDIWFSLNMSMTGVPFNTVDLGGFSENEQVSGDCMHRDENIIRRVIHGLLMFPVPRIHNFGEQPKFPWLYSEDVRRLYREYLELRYCLFPYIYSAAVEAKYSSIPLSRPLVFDYYHDPSSIQVDDQLLFGPYLLIAPVMEDMKEDRMVYLPPGRWVNYRTNEIITGGRSFIVDAPLYETNGLPIFIKMDAVIPYRPVRQFNQDGDEQEVILAIYPETETEYRMWEDEERYSPIKFEKKEENLTVYIGNNTDLTRKYVIRLPLNDTLYKYRCSQDEVSCNENGEFTVYVPPGREFEIILFG